MKAGVGVGVVDLEGAVLISKSPPNTFAHISVHRMRALLGDAPPPIQPMLHTKYLMVHHLPWCVPLSHAICGKAGVLQLFSGCAMI